MNMYCRTFLIVAFTLGMANASLSEDDCVTLKCSDMHVGRSTSPHVSVGKRYPNDELTVTICPAQMSWFNWEKNSLHELQKASDWRYMLYAYSPPGGNSDQMFINRISGEYSYFSKRKDESTEINGNCSEIELKPIPADAGKPKF